MKTFLFLSGLLYCFSPHGVSSNSTTTLLFQKTAKTSSTQPLKNVAFSRRFCHGLQKSKMKPLQRKELARPAIPEHWGLRWGISVGQVIWFFQKHSIPIHQHCFAKTANAYLTQNRFLGKKAMKSNTQWNSTYYFKKDPSFGLIHILLSKSTPSNRREADTIKKKFFRSYGKVKLQRIRRTKPIDIATYQWNVSKTEIRLLISKQTKTNRFDISVRYSSSTFF